MPCARFPSELMDAAHWYVATLDRDLRSVYELRFVAGAGQIEAAESLGISRQRLRTLERKLIDGLRRELAGLGACRAPGLTRAPGARRAG